MRNGGVIVLTAVAVLAGAPAAFAAGYVDGARLYTACHNDRQMALAYTAGVNDLTDPAWTAVNEFRRGLLLKPGLTNAHRKELETELQAILKQLKPHCAPANLSLGRLTDALCRYVVDRPKERTESAAVLFGRALAQTWPCEDGRR